MAVRNALPYGGMHADVCVKMKERSRKPRRFVVELKSAGEMARPAQGVKQLCTSAPMSTAYCAFFAFATLASLLFFAASGPASVSRT